MLVCLVAALSLSLSLLSLSLSEAEASVRASSLLACSSNTRVNATVLAQQFFNYLFFLATGL